MTIEEIINKIDETMVKCGSESVKDQVNVIHDGNYIKLSMKGTIGLYMYIIQNYGGYITCTGLNTTDRHGKIYDYHRDIGEEIVGVRTYRQQIIYDITESVFSFMYFGFQPDDECDDGVIDWEQFSEIQDKEQMMYELPDPEVEFEF